MKSFNLSKGKRLEQQIKSRLYSTSMINQDDYDLEEFIDSFTDEFMRKYTDFSSFTDCS